MADTLYVKTSTGLEALDLGTGAASGGEVAVTREDTTLTEALASGTSFTVPEYTDPAKLLVYYNGLLCAEGSQYTAIGSPEIQFLDDLPAESEITAIVMS